MFWNTEFTADKNNAPPDKPTRVAFNSVDPYTFCSTDSSVIMTADKIEEPNAAE